MRWTHANKAELGITHLIVSGESGGGNLTLTVAHKAKREGWPHEIAGFYAQCPYISNRRLLQAGVPTVGCLVAGTCHAGDLLLPHVMPEVFHASIRDVSGFAKSLSRR